MFLCKGQCHLDQSSLQWVVFPPVHSHAAPLVSVKWDLQRPLTTFLGIWLSKSHVQFYKST